MNVSIGIVTSKRQHARQHQHFDRIEAERADRVDFLARLHRADLRGERAAGAAGDHDRGQQHAEFAQERIADQLDREHARAEVAQHGRAEERDDRADQETQQRDDRHRIQAGLLDVEEQRGHAPAARVRQHARDGRQHESDEADERDPVVPHRFDRAAGAREQVDDAGRARRQLRDRFGLRFRDRIDERAPAGVEPGEFARCVRRRDRAANRRPSYRGD